MTDWIEHDGGPQPVAGDVWVEVSQLYQADDRDLARWIAWDYKLRYRILNQHLIDAARLAREQERKRAKVLVEYVTKLVDGFFLYADYRERATQALAAYRDGKAAQ